MKLLLVYANTYKLLSPPPVGLSMVARSAREAGHEVVVLDLMHKQYPNLALGEALASTNPDVVGFSLRNLDDQCFTNPTSFVPDYTRWVAAANEFAPTVVGGSALMSMPEELFDRVGATYGLCGQGNKVFPQLLEEIGRGATSFETPGAMWRDENGEIQRNPGLHDGYSDDGSIDWSFIDYERYRKSEMPVTVITKTGCRHRCLFCDAYLSFGPDFVTRSPERIVSDLQRDKADYGHNKYGYFFIDPTFNEPLDWAKSVCEAIISSDVRIGYSILLEPAADIDRELIRLLKRSGCVMVTSLLGSIDDGMLERLRAPGTSDDIWRSYKMLEEEKVAYMPQLLLGGPGETHETVEKCLDFVSRLKPIMLDIGYGLRINPGAGIYKIALKEGVVDKDTDMLEPQFYLSPEVDRDWLEKRIKRFKRWRMPAVGQWTRLIWQSMKLRRG